MIPYITILTSREMIIEKDSWDSEKIHKSRALYNGELFLVLNFIGDI